MTATRTGRRSSCLSRYADRLDAEIRVRTRVETVESDGAGFTVTSGDGSRISVSGIVAATGAFGNPLLPALPGREGFTGEVLHAAGYRSPEPYAGRRVVVVGGGNTAVQVAHGCRPPGWSTTSTAPSSWTAAGTGRLWKAGAWPGARRSPPWKVTRSCGRTTPARRRTPSCWPPDTALTWATSRISVRWTPAGCRCTAAASP